MISVLHSKRISRCLSPSDGERTVTEPSEWCLMEYVSVLAGEAPTDRPAGIHPWPAAMGRWVHDRVGPDARRDLRTLAPALVDLDGPDAAVRAAVVGCLAELGAQLQPDSTLYARLRAGRGHPRRLIDLGALVVDVCRAVAVLEPAARDEVLSDLLADVVDAVRATSSSTRTSIPDPSAATEPSAADRAARELTGAGA